MVSPPRLAILLLSLLALIHAAHDPRWSVLDRTRSLKKSTNMFTGISAVLNRLNSVESSRHGPKSTIGDKMAFIFHMPHYEIGSLN